MSPNVRLEAAMGSRPESETGVDLVITASVLSGVRYPGSVIRGRSFTGDLKEIKRHEVLTGLDT
jgi:hypothetical protein